MKLGSPDIASPISEASQAIRVRGQMPGSTVTIFRNSVKWFEATAGTYNELLTPPDDLRAGDEITATQAVGSVTSPRSPIPVVVQPASSLDHLTFASYLYRCAEGIYITGANPGAVIEFRIASHAGGKALAEFGDAQVVFGDRVGSGEVVEARQIVTVRGSTNVGPWMRSPNPDELPRPVPIPTIAAAEACQTAVDFGQLVEGMRVTFKRSSTSPYEFVSVFKNYHLYGLSELRSGESLSASQSFTHCEINSGETNPPVIVGSTSVTAPVVVDNLCAGGQLVRIEKTQEGAQVIVYQDGVEIATTTAYSTYCDVGVEPLVGGTKVTARLIRCGRTSDLSNEARVNPLPGTIVPARIAWEPLYECSSTVPVTSAHPGSRLVIYSLVSGKPISGVVYVDAPDILVPVAPALTKGDKLFVRQYACNGTIVDSLRPVDVALLDRLTVPEVEEPVYAETAVVYVKGVTPGAQVDVFVNGIRQATATAPADHMMVYLPLKLEMEWVVNARQRLCDHVTLPGARRVVRRPPPLLPPFDLSPNGSGRVSRRPVFSWKDGNRPIAKPDHFEVQISTNDAYSDNLDLSGASVPGSTFTPSLDLDFNKAYFWRVRGKNSSGAGPWGVASFLTVEAPPPPAKFDLSLGIDATISLKEVTSVKFGFNGPGLPLGVIVDGVINTGKTSATLSYLLPSDPQGDWYFGVDAEFTYYDASRREWTVLVQNPSPLKYPWSLGPHGTRNVQFMVKKKTTVDGTISYVVEFS